MVKRWKRGSQPRLDRQYTVIFDRLQEADLQFPCHRLDIEVEETVGHGRIEEGGEYASMEDPGIALESDVALEPG